MPLLCMKVQGIVIKFFLVNIEIIAFKFKQFLKSKYSTSNKDSPIMNFLNMDHNIKYN